jgi:hypothetical protein
MLRAQGERERTSGRNQIASQRRVVPAKPAKPLLYLLRELKVGAPAPPVVGAPPAAPPRPKAPPPR